MTEFNRMTLVAAGEVIAHIKSHSEMQLLETQWGIEERTEFHNKHARISSWVKLALDPNIIVITENGYVTLARAIVETAVSTKGQSIAPSWNKLIAGLRFDGFEVVTETTVVKTQDPFAISPSVNKTQKLVRMLPSDVPQLDFREAENEVAALLNQFEFHTAIGHLQQAISAFQRGEWSSANGELRNFYESYLNEIAEALGCSPDVSSKAKRDFLGKEALPPFLLEKYNEWNENNQKPQYIQGLMSRMHPHGGHPGLSEEEDAMFRLQIMLITARLLLRRFKQRLPSSRVV